MRILHTAATYSPSLDGVAEVVRNISERLARKGHQVDVATTAVGSEMANSEIRGVRVSRFSVKGNLTFGMRGEIDEYREFVRGNNWDVVVNHCVQVWSTDALLDEIPSYPWPSILVTHGLSVDNPAFAEYYVKFPQRLSGYAEWIRVSDLSEERLFAEQFHLPAPHLITNGVDLEEWARPPLGLRRAWGIGEKPWVINISNHCRLKGHRQFFRLASRLYSAGANTTLIGGTYPMGQYALGSFGIQGGCAYECRLRTALSTRSIELRTNLTRPEVVSALREADVLVSTSRREANSLVLLESMAAGTPWVSFDVGSARDNVGGVVVRDLDEMTEAVKELLRNPERRVALGRAGQARVASNHAWGPLVDQYEHAYKTVVGRDVAACPY